MDDRDRFFNSIMAVWIPLAQSLFTGILGALLALAGALLAHAENPPLTALATGSLVTLVVWMASTQQWRRCVYAQGEQAQVIQPADNVRIELASDNGRSLQFVDLPASLEQLAALGAGVTSGASLSEAEWIGHGGIFTRSEFVRLRTEMLKRGLAQWNNARSPARGVVLTHGGQAAFRYFATLTHEPPVLIDDGDKSAE